MKDDCVFCKIIKKELPCYNIYEDDMVLVFLSINPYSLGHTLIVPKKHFVNFKDIDINYLNHILEVAKKIYNLLDERLKPDSIKLIQNNGTVQEVKHFHLHLIPLYDKEVKKMSLDEVYEILNKK